MKRWIPCLALLAALSAPAMAAGLLKPQGSELPDLTLEEHHVKVTVNNGFAVTEIDQTFYNPNDRDLDALYTFPLPRDASLSELGLWIDGEERIGEVVEKERARRIVEEEQAAGRDTALAEQRQYIAYDVFVSPVRAASRTRVRLVYLQPVEVDGGIGRYVYPLEEGGIDEEVQAFWTRNARVESRFSFECTIRSEYPLDDVRASGFGRSVVTQNDPNTWTVWIDGEENSVELDRDLVVYYRLAPEMPARVDLLPYRAGDGPGTYMLVITPGADLKPTVEGVDWTVVLDVSGSMGGKIATASDAVSRALGKMRPADRFRLITFANSAEELTPGFVPVDPESVSRYGGSLMQARTRGGTNVYAGVQRGLGGLEADRTSALILVSDGGANVGPTEIRDFLKLLDKKDVRVFTFVMGQGANRPLLERLAEESGGFSMDVSNSDDLYGRLLQAGEKLGREALHGVRVSLDGVGESEGTPHRLPAVYFGQQIVRFGHYRSPGEATLRLDARISGEERSWTTKIRLPERDERFPELERLWALASIQELQQKIDDGGEGSELRSAIVDLAVSHSIVTEYTSMIVVRPERFEELGIDRRNRDRVARERDARLRRQDERLATTRVDTAQPLFGPARAHDVTRSGGSGGAGAVGPGLAVLLAGLAGAHRWSGRRRGRRP